MLLLQRPADGAVIITVPPSDKPTVITVIPNTRTRLTFDAPEEVKIERSEIARPK